MSAYDPKRTIIYGKFEGGNMRINFKTKLAVFLLMMTASIFSGAIAKDKITGIEITLPLQTEWVLVTDQSDSEQYIKEWVPKGQTAQNSNWLIVEQKLKLGSMTSAKSFQKKMFKLAKKACTDVLYNGPEKIVVNKHKTSVGRIMCAKQNGKDYGTFTDQRVLVDGISVYIVTSEIRIPPSEKAGVLKFNAGKFDAKSFMSTQDKSAMFIRKSVQVCFNNKCE